MPIGTVKWFNPSVGYGFIEPSDGSGYAFVHKIAVESAGLKTLVEGQKVATISCPEWMVRTLRIIS